MRMVTWLEAILRTHTVMVVPMVVHLVVPMVHPPIILLPLPGVVVPPEELVVAEGEEPPLPHRQQEPQEVEEEQLHVEPKEEHQGEPHQQGLHQQHNNMTDMERMTIMEHQHRPHQQHVALTLMRQTQAMSKMLTADQHAQTHMPVVPEARSKASIMDMDPLQTSHMRPQHKTHGSVETPMLVPLPLVDVPQQITDHTRTLEKGQHVSLHHAINSEVAVADVKQHFILFVFSSTDHVV